MRELDGRMGANFFSGQKIADIFLKFMPFFRAYIEYTNNFNPALQVRTLPSGLLSLFSVHEVHRYDTGADVS